MDPSSESTTLYHRLQALRLEHNELIKERDRLAAELTTLAGGDRLRPDASNNALIVQDILVNIKAMLRAANARTQNAKDELAPALVHTAPSADFLEGVIRMAVFHLDAAAKPPICPKCGKTDAMIWHTNGEWVCHHTHTL